MTIEIETDEDGTIRHLKDGKRHREDGPAVIWADGSLEWWINGLCHRDAGPAIIYADGGPNVTSTDLNYWWYRNGELHREDGPAVIWPDGSLEWYLDGKECTFNEWCQKANITDQQKTLLLMKYS